MKGLTERDAKEYGTMRLGITVAHIDFSKKGQC